MLQIIGMLAGIISGSVWEYLGTNAYKEYPTLFPGLLTNHAGKTLHLHHWFIYFLIILFTSIWAYKTNKLFHPATIMFEFFFLAGIIFDIFKYPNWYKFIY